MYYASGIILVIISQELHLFFQSFWQQQGKITSVLHSQFIQKLTGYKEI